MRDWGRVKDKPPNVVSVVLVVRVVFVVPVGKNVQNQRGERKEEKPVVQTNSMVPFNIITSLWVVFGLSTLNFKKLVDQLSKSAFFQIPVGSNPRTSFLLSNKLNILFVLPSFLEHLEINEHHRQKNMTRWWPFCSRRSCSERGKYQNNGLVTGALFFSSPLVKD